MEIVLDIANLVGIAHLQPCSWHIYRSCTISIPVINSDVGAARFILVRTDKHLNASGTDRRIDIFKVVSGRKPCDAPVKRIARDRQYIAGINNLQGRATGKVIVIHCGIRWPGTVAKVVFSVSPREISIVAGDCGVMGYTGSPIENISGVTGYTWQYPIAEGGCSSDDDVIDISAWIIIVILYPVAELIKNDIIGNPFRASLIVGVNPMTMTSIRSIPPIVVNETAINFRIFSGRPKVHTHIGVVKY